MKRKRIEIRGIVQGVGFRPFVYHLAIEHGLTGYILNTSEGVLIEAQGSAEAVDGFVRNLSAKAPPFAQIDHLATADLKPSGETAFNIRESVGEAGKLGLVLPDIATCADCFRDFTDPANRRFGYPFTNCTNCGPRYTIIEDLPYDRPNTTMRVFPMCADCRAEYEDPANRRFHAQPNACAVCGPRLELVESVAGATVRERAHAAPPIGCERPGDALRPDGCPSGHGRASDGGDALPHPAGRDASDGNLQLIRKTRELLRAGRIVAIKGLGGFHLACDATNDEAVRALRQSKKRSDKPFALMARDIPAVERFCVVSEADRAALLSPLRPVVILPRRATSPVSPEIAPGNRTVGVMLPYTPLHHLLFADLPADGSQAWTPAPLALVMTSGNLSEEPIVTGNTEAWERLGQVADWFLFHNRDIYMRVDDSVVRIFDGGEVLIRRSRGHAPRPIDLGMPLAEVLACGAELKNTFCLTKDHYALVSQHIGDLENYETLVFFRETLDNMKKLFRVTPRLVAHDLHPDYLSTRFAMGLEGVEKVGVQHHHAHIAACMAENHLSGKVIGVALDGTGYGADGRIWGGEFLVAGYGGFERRAHLAYVPLAGGDTAIRQPWRSALSHLIAAFEVSSDRAATEASRRSDRAATEASRPDDGYPSSVCGSREGAVPAGASRGVREDPSQLPSNREPRTANLPGGRPWSRLWPAVPEKSVALVEAMIRRGVNTVDTSSCGRLFDAVAAIVGLRHEVNFEGQAAIELEMIAEEGIDETYPFQIGGGTGAATEPRPEQAAAMTGTRHRFAAGVRERSLPLQIDVRPMIRRIVGDLDCAIPAARISARFHNTMAAIIIDMCRRLRDTDRLQRVCLSGGTFQNFYLLSRAVAGLRREGFEVYLHSKVPPNDGCISLGQAVIANALLHDK